MKRETYEVRVYGNGDRLEWRQNGELHRLDGPAIVLSNGYEAWYQNGNLHKIGGPAIKFSDGGKAWYQDDNRHRLDGPAIEYSNGDKYWYQNGLLHRLNGPAVEYNNGGKAWCIEGFEYTEQRFNEITQKPNNPDPCDGKVIEHEGKKYKLSRV